MTFLYLDPACVFVIQDPRTSYCPFNVVFKGVLVHFIEVITLAEYSVLLCPAVHSCLK